MAPRPVPHWDPDLCHHSAQTCATLVPMPSWESIDRRRDAAAVPLSGLPALQCRAARRQPVFLAGTREPELQDPKSPAPPLRSLRYMNGMNKLLCQQRGGRSPTLGAQEITTPKVGIIMNTNMGHNQLKKYSKYHLVFPTCCTFLIQLTTLTHSALHWRQK